MEENVTADRATDGVQPVDFGRVAALLSDLAGDVTDSAVRAQLSAAAGIIASAPGLRTAPSERAPLEEATAGALEAGDLTQAVSAAADLAAFDRARVSEIDWSAASGA